MSVSIEDVLNGAGYDINKYDDAQWLLAQRDEWEELIDRAGETVDTLENNDEDNY